MARPLDITAVLAARRERGLVAVFDFDGTLVEIGPSPEAIRTPPALSGCLERIADRRDTTLGIVSGRPLAALLARLDVPSAWLFGLHGWERRAPGQAPTHTWSHATLALAARQRRILQEHLEPAGGELIEDKGACIAVHTRRTSPARQRHVERILREMRLPDFELVMGRSVFELRPANGLTKGTAVRTIAAQRAGAAILYVGDDVTDEDAFRVLGPGDFPVLVDDAAAHHERPALETRARYTVPGPAAVAVVVSALADEPMPCG